MLLIFCWSSVCKKKKRNENKKNRLNPLDTKNNNKTLFKMNTSVFSHFQTAEWIFCCLFLFLLVYFTHPNARSLKKWMQTKVEFLCRMKETSSRYCDQVVEAIRNVAFFSTWILQTNTSIKTQMKFDWTIRISLFIKLI